MLMNEKVEVHSTDQVCVIFKIIINQFNSASLSAKYSGRVRHLQLLMFFNNVSKQNITVFHVEKYLQLQKVHISYN